MGVAFGADARFIDLNEARVQHIVECRAIACFDRGEELPAEDDQPG